MQIVAAAVGWESWMFLVISGLFGIYMIAWFIWTMYRITTLKQQLNWVDGVHIVGLFLYMMLLQMMRQDLALGRPVSVSAQIVATRTPLKVAQTRNWRVFHFTSQGVDCYAVLADVEQARLQAFVTENAIKLKPESEKNAAMAEFLEPLTNVSKEFALAYKEDIEAPRYTPFTMAFGDGLIVPVKAEPGIQRIYIRLAIPPTPEEKAKAEAQAK